MRRKSPKTHQEPPGSWTSGEGGLAPFDPPALCPSGIGCGSIEPAASSGAILPSHGLTAEGVTPGKTRGEKKTGLPTYSKWQIGLGLWQKVARRETERSAASAKRAAATHRGIPKGAALGAPLVTFPASGKSPGCRAERLQVGAGTTSPAKTPGAWGGAPIHGGCGGRRPPLRGVQRGRQPPRIVQ